MTATEVNEDIQDQICDLIHNLQQIVKLKNKDMRVVYQSQIFYFFSIGAIVNPFLESCS